MKTRSLRRIGALLLALALACSLLTLPVSAASIGDNFTLDVGKTQQLTASDDMGDTVTWNSSNPSAATVSNSGLVTAVAPGTANILAMGAGGAYAQCTVTVTAVRIPATGIRLDTMFLQKMEGDPSVRLTATVSPSNSTDTVSFTSDDPTIVSVDQYGNLNFLKPGTAQITAAAGDKKDFCVVNVTARPAVSGVTITPRYVNLSKGERATLTATVEGTQASQGVVWSPSSSAISVPQTSQSGAPVEIRVGEQANIGDQITVTARAAADLTQDAVCIVTVIAPATPTVESVSIISPSTDAYRYVDPGKTMQLEATAYPLEASEVDRRITWSSEDTAIARVNQNTGLVTGVAPGRTIITAKSGGGSPKTDSREIETSGIILSYTERSPSGGVGTTKRLTSTDVIPIYQYRDVSIKWELFGNAKSKTITWNSSNNSVAQVVSGRVTANYPGEATITATVDGTGFSASFNVRVSEDVADAISISMGSSSTYSFANLLSQLNSRSLSKAGGPLESVYSLNVSTKNGVLYYRYTSQSSPGHGVGGTERYYYQPLNQGQMALKDVSFVPLPGFNGTAVVEYNASSTNGNNFTGTIRIEANAAGGINYNTAQGQPVTFAAQHFSDVCKGRNGQSISYVTFTQPSSGQGTLYYNYNPGGLYSPKVDSSTRYYATSNPSINNITFVPAEGYSGEVRIPYRCTDSTGATYTGYVTVTVHNAGGGTSTGTSRDVEYYTGLNQRQSLNGGDFNDASYRATGYNLNYIRFNNLPSSSVGTLYLNYTNSSSARVTTGTHYYLNSSPRISSITFVPAGGYGGTVYIPFTGTTVSSGNTFSGNLIIHVNGGTGTIYYNTYRNQSVNFYSGDFNNACRNATGYPLNYIRFNTVSTSYGSLYYQYNTSTRTGASVSTSTSYYYSGNGNWIGNVSFAANSNSGTARIGYTGYSTQGTSFSGTVEVTVSGSATSTTGGYTAPSGSTASSSTIRYTGSSTPIRFQASDFQAPLRNALSYVQFNTLPAVGHLYQNYSSPSQTGAGVNASAHYTSQDLDQISYLPQAEYQGTLSIPYTAYDSQGAGHSGTVEIQLSNSYATTSFSDVASGLDWAKPSIEYLRQSGITSGYSDGTFRPRQSISRGEFTLMICRAFNFPTTGSSGFSDVPANSTYAGAVASARNLGIVQGNNGRFQPDRPITRQSAMTMICRALEAAGQSVPAADTSLLSNYSDGAQVSSFARSSVASLIQMGAVRGNSSMQLNPSAAISRAEMAVILHRVLAR